MEQKGLTKKQFRMQMGLVIFWELYAAYFTVSGILDHSTFKWIMGAAFGAFYLAYGIYLIILRKKHPVEDLQLDKQVEDNFKTGLKGTGIFFAVLAAGFLIAFGLVALFK